MMYSVVLITALATAPTTPGFGHRCHGCYSSGCSCSYSGCSCSCYGGCYSCSGTPQYGAAGGCYGYHGGCYSAFGNNYMAPYGVYGPYMSTSCYGCYGGYSCFGVPVPGWVPAPPVVDPYPPINPKKEPKGEEVPLPKDKQKEEKKLEARAKIRIDVPVGGKLFVDGRHIATTPGTRVFQTPALMPGEAYFYDIRIEVDNRSAERRVVISAGQDARVSFPALIATTK
jgi:uncharacterized protein (TIGR03000 family)